jgi:hypothetical protein
MLTTMIRATWSILLFRLLFLFLLPRPVNTAAAAAAAWSVEGNRYIRKKLPKTLTSQETIFRFPDESKILHEDHYSTHKDDTDMYTEEKLPNRDFLYARVSRKNAGRGHAFLTNDQLAHLTPPKVDTQDPLKPHLDEEGNPPYHDLFPWF